MSRVTCFKKKNNKNKMIYNAITWSFFELVDEYMGADGACFELTQER